MLTILQLLKGPANSHGRHDDYWSDRLSHRYTVGVLISLSIIVTANHLVGERIQCLTPAEYSGAWQAYVNNYCWVQNTYYVPEFLRLEDADSRTSLAYYQWVPLLLQLQAFCYYLPCLLWRTLYTRSGIDLDNFLKINKKISAAEDIEERKKLIKHAVILTDGLLTRRRIKNTGFTLSITYFLNKLCPRLGRSRGNFLTVLYLLIKVLFLVNAVAQFALMDDILKVNFTTYGVDAIRLALSGEDISLSYRFPRVTLCDFKIRVLSAEPFQTHTVQCVLPINLFHEMVYLLLWFWMVSVVLVSLYSLIVWTIRTFSSTERHNFVAFYMKYFAANNPDSIMKANFTSRYLRHDGVFLLRILSANNDDVIAHDVCKALWEKYSEPHQPKAGPSGLYPTEQLMEVTKL